MELQMQKCCRQSLIYSPCVLLSFHWPKTPDSAWHSSREDDTAAWAILLESSWEELHWSPEALLEALNSELLWKITIWSETDWLSDIVIKCDTLVLVEYLFFALICRTNLNSRSNFMNFHWTNILTGCCDVGGWPPGATEICCAQQNSELGSQSITDWHVHNFIDWAASILMMGFEEILLIPIWNWFKSFNFL